MSGISLIRSLIRTLSLSPIPFETEHKQAYQILMLIRQCHCRWKAWCSAYNFVNESVYTHEKATSQTNKQTQMESDWLVAVILYFRSVDMRERARERKDSVFALAFVFTYIFRSSFSAGFFHTCTLYVLKPSKALVDISVCEKCKKRETARVCTLNGNL